MTTEKVDADVEPSKGYNTEASKIHSLQLCSFAEDEVLISWIICCLLAALKLYFVYQSIAVVKHDVNYSMTTLIIQA